MKENKVKFENVIGIERKKTTSSLGIETLGGASTILIKKGTVVPSKVAQTFSTAEDNQAALSIRVLKGEGVMAADNKILSNFELADIPSGPRGMPQIQVIFDIDEKGSLSVSAIDKETTEGQKIEIQKSGKVKTKSVSSSDIVEEDYTPRVEIPAKPNSIIEFSLKWAAAGAIFGFAILANQISNGNVVTTEDRLAGATAGAIVGFIIGAIYKSYKKE